MTALQRPLDKPAGMGIIKDVRGRCIRRSVPVSLKLYLDLNDPQKPSPCPVAVFAFQSLDSYRDRMTQNMNRKHEKHTVPPPFEEVTNRLTMYAASLGRVYTAGGFLSNSGGRTWASPLRGDGFPRQCEHWLGMTALPCRANGTSYPKGICSAALHCRTPSPTKSQGVRCKKGGQGRPPLHVLCGTSYPKGICSAALHCRTPSPTKSQGVRCKKGGQVSALYIPIIYDSAQRHDAL